MKLPNDSIGITDILSYRDCPRRFEFGMRRHTTAGEHPEAQTTSTAYGSAIHEAIAYAEAEQASDEGAIQHAVDRYARWLEPADLERLHDDMRTYRERDYTGVRTIAVEREVRVPLFIHNGQTIYFRAKLDRVYQRLDNPAVFVHIDYKSSRHAKTEADVHADLQMWAYNWLIHEEWPECEQLVQVYDQLAHGAIPTRKSADQRASIRDWLVAEITAILHDENLNPERNRWCQWCPIMESCPIIGQLTEWARAEIDGLAPADQDAGTFADYAARLDDVKQARKLLARFEDSVTGVLRDMDAGRRRELGYQLRDRSVTSWPPEALRAVHDALGDDFYDLVSMTKGRAEKHPQRDVLMAYATSNKGAAVVSKT